MVNTEVIVCLISVGVIAIFCNNGIELVPSIDVSLLCNIISYLLHANPYPTFIYQPQSVTHPSNEMLPFNSGSCAASSGSETDTVGLYYLGQ